MQSRSQLIYLYYQMQRRRLEKSGTLPVLVDLRARMDTADRFKLKSFLDVDAYIRQARKELGK